MDAPVEWIVSPYFFSASSAISAVKRLFWNGRWSSGFSLRRLTACGQLGNWISNLFPVGATAVSPGRGEIV
jgi:hypothetical protein